MMIGLMLQIAALVCFVLAASTWKPAAPYAISLIAAGLACQALVQLLVRL